MHELQSLGEALVALSDERLDTLEIPDRLREAVRELRHIKSFEGRRRQMQYVGKLMRGVDPDPIREAVLSDELGRTQQTLALHRAERWRADLIASDEALTRWMSEHPDTDVQQLRRLVRAARKDAAAAPEQRSGRAYRELFQLIKQSPNDHDGDHDSDHD